MDDDGMYIQGFFIQKPRTCVEPCFLFSLRPKKKTETDNCTNDTHSRAEREIEPACDLMSPLNSTPESAI